MTTSEQDGLAARPEDVPSRASWILFAVRQWGLRARRWMSDVGGQVRRHPRSDDGSGFAHITGESRTDLWIEAGDAERAFERGKVQNLRRAALALDGVVIPAGQTFSFWRQVGPPSARRGFATGRMLQQGCMVASVGGGLCQLTNSLYDVALQAGCAIVERHRHSRIVPGSQAQRGRDATVAWNYVDLRFRPAVAMWLSVVADDRTLTVALLQHEPPGPLRLALSDEQLANPTAVARTCSTCGESSCHRHEAGALDPLACRWKKP